MSEFPHAPHGWDIAKAKQAIEKSGLNFKDDYIEVIKALQSYFSRHDKPNRRELTDALEERFHVKGGLKYLYKLLPKGPVAQGCQIAGLAAPAGSIDQSFGSVV